MLTAGRLDLRGRLAQILRSRLVRQNLILFAGGLVHTKNGKFQVVAWPEVDELLLWRAGGKTAMAGKLLCYYVVTFDGRKVPIELQSAKGDKTLGERLQQIVTGLGRPVVESGPYSGRLRP